jgi:hypothetical protein
MNDDNNVLLCGGDDDFELEDEAINMCHLSEPITSIISFEDWNELTNSEQPDISDWKDYPLNYEELQKIDVHITFNEVTRNAWETVKEEISSILENQCTKNLMSDLQIDFITLLRWLNDICI